MDVPRTQSPGRSKRRILIIAILVTLAIVAAVALAQLRPAGAPVTRTSVMTDTVKRATLVRNIRGSGTLVPENLRWIAAATAGQIEKVVVQPGTRVTADTVVIELSDPQQVQAAADAEWQLRGAEADLESLKASLELEQLAQQAAHAQLRAELESARLRAESDAQMAKQGIVADLSRKMSATNLEQLERRVALDDQRLALTTSSLQSRLAAQRAAVEMRRALYALRKSEVDALRVRAGIDGVLQQVSVTAGQRVAAGTPLARVAQPEQLKAEIQIAEAQAKDVYIGAPATVDTHNGMVAGVVSRIDPAARQGSVTLDIRITAPLPKGARPDLSVEAMIELGRVADALQVARPVGAQEQSSGTVFKVVDNGRAAERVQVAFGVSSADSIQITQGLQVGDEIVVSDTSNWDKFARIEFR
jgi:HlyD family secretion protein